MSCCKFYFYRMLSTWHHHRKNLTGPNSVTKTPLWLIMLWEIIINVCIYIYRFKIYDGCYFFRLCKTDFTSSLTVINNVIFILTSIYVIVYLVYSSCEWLPNTGRKCEHKIGLKLCVVGNSLIEWLSPDIIFVYWFSIRSFHYFYM